MFHLPSQLIVDFNKCTGCRICELACSAKHEGKFQPSLARLKIVRYDDLALDIPNVCGPCETAPCVDICPVFAMRRDPITKMTYLDEDKCILCKSCVGACVNGVILLDTVKMRIIIGVLIGGGIGFLVGHFGKCASGTCPLTGNPIVSTTTTNRKGDILFDPVEIRSVFVQPTIRTNPHIIPYDVNVLNVRPGIQL